MKSKTKIVITGGGGALGRSLLERLKKDNFEIFVLDKNIRKDLKNEKHLKFVKCDIANSDISEYLKDADYIFHLASIMPKSADISIAELLENIKMTVNIALANKRAKIIYASGNNVYGIPVRIPIKENDPLKPTELYGQSKLYSEILLNILSQKCGWPLVILRFANIYGPEFKRREGALFNFFSKLVKDELIEIYGSGNQKRDRVWFEDVVNALILSMKKGVEGIFNIGSGKSYSTLEVASLIAGFLKKKPRFVFKKNADIKKKNILLDIQKARKILKYRPKAVFRNKLKSVIDIWKKNYADNLL